MGAPSIAVFNKHKPTFDEEVAAEITVLKDMCIITKDTDEKAVTDILRKIGQSDPYKMNAATHRLRVDTMTLKEFFDKYKEV